MLKCTFIFLIDRLKELHKAMLNAKSLPFLLHYTINRRINRLDIKINDNKSSSKEFKDEYIIIAIDSTGMKVTNNRGHQWMREKWHIKNKKGYLKIHVAVNVKSKKILSIKVTDEHVHDSKALPELVENIIKSDSVTTTAIGKLFGDDGAYDGNDVFRCLWRTMEYCLIVSK